MSRARTPDYQAVRQALGRNLRALREDCPPMETARLLLSYDGPGQALVGLRHDGARAVYVQARGRDAVAVAFDGFRPQAHLDVRPVADLAHQVV